MTLYGNEKPTSKNIGAHHVGDGFQNDPFVETASSKGVLFYLRRFWSSIFVPDIPEGHVVDEDNAIHAREAIRGDKITWLGHASFLITMSGKTILTDPFLTEFASPVSWSGPRRFVDPGIGISRLPTIDFILVSHNHYDHLDDKTVRKLYGKEHVRAIVPLGLKSFFDERGYQNVIELDWGESAAIEGLKFTAQPAVHDSARSLGDQNKTLWSSWTIHSPTTKIFFVGDSGYSDSIFKRVGREHGPFHYAILPIGAYEPRKLMWMSHMTPEEATKIGKEVNAMTLIASHWGTVSSLSDEPMWEPPVRFNRAGKENGFEEKNLWVLKIGESKALSY